MRKRRFILRGLAAVVLLVVVVLSAFLHQIVLPIIAGYTAKVFTSAYFVAGRPEAQIVSEDVAQYIDYFNWAIDEDAKSVTVSFYGLASRTARFFPGIGVTLLPIGADTVNFDTAFVPTPIPENDNTVPWPDGNGAVVDSLDPGARTALDDSVAWAFQEPGGDVLLQTRAVLVVHEGKLIAERYAEGTTRETPLLGWSMSKSVTAALVGLLVKEGKLDVMQPAPVAEWQGPEDPRAAITLDMLLRMSDGLDYSEDYAGPFADVLHMLYLSDDFGGYTASRTLAFPPDTHWNYSSGTANLVSRIVREAVGGTQSDYLNFPREALFKPLGMASALMEPDPSGTLVGSSYTYATARDWARFGQLYLQDGVWKGERLLPEGWVAYNSTPTSDAPRGNYGAHWWLNAGVGEKGENPPMPTAPRDLFFASGHEGQFVIVVPSRNMVIVRLGLTTSGTFPLQEFIRRVVEAVPR
mgnify:CR=1 FL=1